MFEDASICTCMYEKDGAVKWCRHVSRDQDRVHQSYTNDLRLVWKYFQLKPCELQIPQIWSKLKEFIHFFNWKAATSGWNLFYESASNYFMWFKIKIYKIGFKLMKRKVLLVCRNLRLNTRIHFIKRFLRKLGTTYNCTCIVYIIDDTVHNPVFGINKSSKYK